MKNHKYIIVYLILILIVGLMGCFCYYHRNDVVQDGKLRDYANKSVILMRKNDSLMNKNKELSTKIDGVKTQTEVFKNRSIVLDSEKKRINRQRDEIPNYVEHLPANGVSDAFTKYLDKKTESRNPN